MTLKILQDIGVFNVSVLFTFLNVYSLDGKSDSQHSPRESRHPCNTYFFIAKFHFSSFLRLVCSRLLFIILMLSNLGTLFLLTTSTGFLIVLHTGGLFGLNVEINVKTSTVCFYFGFLSSY